MKFQLSAISIALSNCLLIGNAVIPHPAFAQSANTLSLEQRQKQAQEFDQASQEAIEKKNYLAAAELAIKGHQVIPNGGGLAYNAACAYALAGKTELAFQWLDHSLEAGYARLDHIQTDSDLESLRADPRWASYIGRVKESAKIQAALWDSSAWKTPFAEQLSEEERVAGLSKFWSEVKYNFIFTDTLKKLDWDAVYLKYLTRVKAATSTAEYYRILMEMCALLQDGHTNIAAPDQLYSSEFTVPPFRTRLIEGKIIITDVADAPLREQGIVRGVEVSRVNGVNAQDWARKHIAPIVSASTPQDLDSRIFGSQFLMGRKTDRLQVEFKDTTGKTWVSGVERVTYGKRNQGIERPGAFSWKMLDGEVAYVALNSFGDDTAANEYLKNFAEISKAKAIIFDVRENGGGSSTVGYKVLATLTDQATSSSHAETRDYKPSYRAWGRPDSNFNFNAWSFPAHGQFHFKGKVVVLTSPRTYSAAEDFAVAFDWMKRGVIIGEATGGSTGQPLSFTLPGGGSARVCTKKDTYPDGKEFVGVGVQPHKHVIPRLEDYRNGKDTVLDAALAYLKK
ncbi:S41 family peptidase [Undibacterium cyanobacteriorum]|uniref:S41 family peptidase n=1 Tax=Undibacterium cyanobacteriorum TaxID=3073561 RepID=A0ABY9RK26_9BURK|nr:S41 family peptidase [Undibacterium sp. 20NA77.5]WMW81015.1 S41 family peptidase [Undibacterium sp. 20NA77.5]